MKFKFFQEYIQNISQVVFPMVARVVAMTVANDLVPVEPMEGPTGRLFYMDFEFQNKKFKFFRGYE